MNEYKQVIEIFKMENELMEFNPSTGEKNPIELQNKDNQDLYKANLVAIEVLEKQLNNGWVPASERLPEKSDVYLATFLEEGKRYVERFYYSDFMGWMMPVAWQDEGRIKNIIAWQPLPEPWKGGGL